MSRTERVRNPSVDKPAQCSALSGPFEIRPRVGFSPTRPQNAAGVRTDPPPSVPCPSATIPAATAAPEPPLDPPALWSVAHGLRVGP